MTLSCISYKIGELIPAKFLHRSLPEGRNISPGFEWSDPPVGTKSFALVIVDRHPVANNWVHWLLVNIPFNVRRIVEGCSRTNSLPRGSKELMNSFGDLGYGGPAPPKGSGIHSYVATLFALNLELASPGLDINLRRFEQILEGRVIEESSIHGDFGR